MKWRNGVGARDIQIFEVSLKAFVVRNREALFVREADTGYWELPGGRINVGEEMLHPQAILERELREELGPTVAFGWRPEFVTWTRRRAEDGRFLFLAARIGLLTAGEVILSDEHDAFAWLPASASEELELPPNSGYTRAIADLWSLVKG